MGLGQSMMLGKSFCPFSLYTKLLQAAGVRQAGRPQTSEDLERLEALQGGLSGRHGS